MRTRLIENIYHNVIVFMLLFLSVSFAVTNDIISGTLTIGLWLLVFFLIVFVGKGRISIPLILLAITSLLLMLLTTVVFGESIDRYLKIAVSFIVVALYVSRTSLKRFSLSYVKVMRFFCIVSLIGYGLNLVVPSVFERFIVYNAADSAFSNYYVYVQWASSGDNAYRNWGFAWEPGAFATFVCLAMFLDLFFASTTLRLRTIALYVITAITTFSTMGIVMILALSIFVINADKTISKSTKYAVVICLVLAIVVMMSFSDILFDTNTNSTFGKIINFLNAGDGKNTGSAAIRYYSITEGFAAFLRSPFFGWGYDGLIEQTKEFTKGMNTCTFINWFAVYGIVYGMTMIGGIWRFTKMITPKMISRLLIVLFIFGITMTENYVHCPMIFLLVLYGYVIIPKQYNRRVKTI